MNFCEFSETYFDLWCSSRMAVVIGYTTKRLMRDKIHGG
uniref:Uncharacterized protein n=1 Tax=Strigamia maritima TaxID=126957 RepID=T1IM75_STRMM